MQRFDVVVVGLGIAGSAAASELARRGHRVVGLDRYGPVHARGGSHGESRLVRAVYYEGPHYVPLLRRAYPAWRELEERSGRELMLRTGCLTVGPPDGELAAGSRRAAGEYDLELEELSPAAVRERYPAFRVPDGHVALLDPAAGVLRADRCLSVLRSEAREAGGELRFGEGVLDWRPLGEGLEVETAEGTIRADAGVLAAGGWSPELAGDTPLPLTVERQTVHHFPPGERDAYGPGRFPVFLHEREDGTVAYGVADLGRGVKAAVHHGGKGVESPEEVDREVRPEEGGRARDAVRELLPGLAPDPVRSEVCLYANTPDRDFVVDRLPGGVVACGFSGHGFKFAPVVAELVVDLLEGRTPEADLSPFRLGRWDG